MVNRESLSIIESAGAFLPPAFGAMDGAGKHGNRSRLQYPEILDPGRAWDPYDRILERLSASLLVVP